MKKKVFKAKAELYVRDNMDVLKIKLPKNTYTQIELDIKIIEKALINYILKNKKKHKFSI